jgi:hypothetical protein
MKEDGGMNVPAKERRKRTKPTGDQVVVVPEETADGWILGRVVAVGDGLVVTADGEGEEVDLPAVGDRVRIPARILPWRIRLRGGAMVVHADDLRRS